MFHSRRQVKLKEVCDRITVGFVGAMAKEYVETGVPLLRSLNVRPFKLKLNDIKFISQDFHQKIKKSALKEGDVVIVRTGAPGTSCVIPTDFDNLNCSDLVIATPDKDKLNSHYLSFYFNTLASHYVSSQLVGAIQQHFNIGSAKEMVIDLPSIEEQNEIVEFVNSINSKIELNNRINAELEAMAKTIYDYWFVQFDFPISAAYAASVGKPELEGRPYKSSGGEMVWNEEIKRDIPKGWTHGELKDISKITMGQSPPGASYNDEGEGTVFYQGCTDFGPRFPTVRKYTTQPTRFAKAGDILLSVRAPVGTMNIANEDCCIGRGLAALKSKNGSDAYLYEVLKYFKQIFDRRNVDGTTFGAITKNDLFSLSVVMPPPEMISAYETAVGSAFKKLNVMEAENRELASLRDWLLPMLMNGQVKVGDVKGYEENGHVRMAAEGEEKYNLKK